MCPSGGQILPGAAVRITKCRLDHNYGLSEDSFWGHPARRLVLDEDNVDPLWRAEQKKGQHSQIHRRQFCQQPQASRRTQSCPQVEGLNTTAVPAVVHILLSNEIGTTPVCPCAHDSSRVVMVFAPTGAGFLHYYPDATTQRRRLLPSVRPAIELNRSTDTTPLTEPITVRRVLAGTDRPSDNKRKYPEATPIATYICNTNAGLGMHQYHAMNYLQEVGRQIKKGTFSQCGRTRRAALEAMLSDIHVS
ncbi:unnamed protein product [Phytophthora fragariaefolia]|uniref:Unnamed protein product n=1 Tax=Phytophthora fragariaefolia TaxID=1490495 RepID=A0A9W6U9Y6_9STRA|nr:unnamed protein product [Phytophthora fragariaefolia]